jgi:hypothetical protein
MRAAVSNATPLMYLTKIRKINLLRKFFDKIYIPSEVFVEVVTEGKRLNRKEIFLIENLIRDDFIEIREVEKSPEIKSLHEGEAKAIALCRELRLKIILIDDKEGYEFSKLLNLSPLRTTALLLRFYKEDFFSYKEFCDAALKLSEEGYFLSAKVYEELIKIARAKSKVFISSI